MRDFSFVFGRVFRYLGSAFLRVSHFFQARHFFRAWHGRLIVGRYQIEKYCIAREKHKNICRILVAYRREFYWRCFCLGEFWWEDLQEMKISLLCISLTSAVYPCEPSILLVDIAFALLCDVEVVARSSVLTRDTSKLELWISNRQHRSALPDSISRYSLLYRLFSFPHLPNLLTTTVPQLVETHSTDHAHDSIHHCTPTSPIHRPHPKSDPMTLSPKQQWNIRFQIFPISGLLSTRSSITGQE